MARRASRKAPSGADTALAIALLALLAFAGVRVAMLQLADQWAAAAPARAFALVPTHETAAIAVAMRALEDGRPQAAAASARALLAREPSRGEAFRVIGLAAAAQGDAAAAWRAMRIAVRRAPRDMVARGWTAEEEIARGRYAAGLAQLDAVMRLSPRHVDLIVPLLATLAEDPAFANAVRVRLRAQPRWGAMLVARMPALAGPDARAAATAGSAPASERVRALRLGGRVAALVDPRGRVPAGR